MKTLRFKLIISFLAVIILSQAYATFNYLTVDSMNQKTKNIMTEQLPLLIEDENLSYNIAQSLSVTRAYVLYGDDTFKNEFNELTAEGLEIQKELKKYKTSPKLQGIINESNAWREMVETEIFQKYDEGFKEVADKNLRTKAQPIARGIMDGLEKLAGEREKDIQSNGGDMLSYADTIQKVGIAASLTVLILGIIIAIFTAESISRPVKKIVTRMMSIAKGELSSEVITTKSKDEIGHLVQAVNTMNGSLQSMVKQMADVSNHVTSQSEELTQYADEVMAGSQQIATTMSDLSSGAEEQAHASTSLNETMGQFAQEIMNVVINSEDIKAQAATMLGMTNDGSQYMEKSIQKMDDINGKMKHSLELVKGLDTRTNDISKLVNVIQEIAEQTNLLALNAAIEAARAGEHGRGFAVVADEVRKLAEQVSHSITDITSIVTDIQNESKQVVASLDEGYEFVNEGTDQIQTTGKTFDNIKEAIDEVGSKIEEMSSSLYNVLDNTKTINESIENIASVSEESAAGIEQISATAQQSGSSMSEVSRSARTLEDSANQLNSLIQGFKIK
ncbi:methyl-accepting chemotaxis protein [Ferdinandcohnia quinoae]|uniref:Methyl-accepting chemotaxis protein n=1 Tax=Fredinandcohnia quinoae TaxID=2918902 RepID=A0AAW5EE06_9BACI|nr:methyl-accepting chemotaxis protein [Fredinandcohnia sp. SECRCQ15]MCH1627970.1 methyl-accepting chemotaxis protein [Fredinandcohnia sp. SECRCQ15]